MLTLKKYFVPTNNFEVQDSNTGEVIIVSMDRFVRGTVAGYIFHDENFNVEMHCETAKTDIGSLVINIADCGRLEVLDEDNVVKEAHVSVAFVAPKDLLRCFVFMDNDFDKSSVVDNVISALRKGN